MERNGTAVVEQISAGRGGRQHPLTMARRRRMVGGLVAGLACALLAGSTPAMRPLLWVAAGLAVLLGLYLALLVYIRNSVAPREARVARHLACDWSSSPYLLDRWAITRFLWAGLVGGLLQVLMALTQRLVDRRLIGDGSGQAWLVRSLRLQDVLRRHSARVLFVSATAAAGATAVTSIGSVAAASPVPTISLPVSPASPAEPVSSYTVVEGDTLTTIAARFATSASALAGLNHLADPNLILAGQVLHVIGGAAAPARPPLPTGTGPASTYTVAAGDTLDAVAARFGTSVSALVALNHLTNPNLILVGQVLALSTTGDSDDATVIAGAPAPATAPPSVTSPPSPPSAATTPPNAPPPAASANSAAGTAAATAVRVALAQVGKPYVWGGAGPNDFDCSGLVMYAWEAAGVNLPHYSVSQYDDTARISAAQLTPGDLVFYGGSGPGEPGHVDLYIGAGQVVAADNAGTDVRVESIDFAGAPSAYGQVG